MSLLDVPGRSVPTVASTVEASRRTWRWLYGAILVATAAVGGLAFATANRFLALALVLLVLGSVVAIARPALGVLLIAFFTLVSDAGILGSYPFVRQLSSVESTFFIDHSLTVSPLEVFLLASTAGLFLQIRSTPGMTLRRGTLFVPLAIFTVFVIFGVVRGLAPGGDARIAVFELRPLLYVPVVYVLVTNLVRRRPEVIRLLVVSMIAIVLNSLFALDHYGSLSTQEREVLQSLTEHGASVHVAALLILVLALWLLSKATLAYRLSATAAAVPCLAVFLYSERRAAVVAFAVGLLLLCMVLRVRNRRAFRWFVPVVAVLTVAYLGAFWGATEATVGFPAQAIKGVIAPGALSEEDRASNLYRDLEAFNIWFTLRVQPLLGVGFGQKFYQPAPVADISFFEFWEYIPHNSLLWVWMKTGYLGFVALLFLFARAIQEGIRTVCRCTSGTDAAFVVAALSYVVMFVVFAYVDIAWEARSAVFLGVALACCADFPAGDDGRGAAETTSRQRPSLVEV